MTRTEVFNFPDNYFCQSAAVAEKKRGFVPCGLHAEAGFEIGSFSTSHLKVCRRLTGLYTA